MKKNFLTILFSMSALVMQAQTDEFSEAYQAFRQQAKAAYGNFREEANQQYADFMKKAWEMYQQKPAILKPKEEEAPPVIRPKQDEERPVESRPVKIDGDVVTLPQPKPQPKPLGPIQETPVEESRNVGVTFLGTSMSVRFHDTQEIVPAELTEHGIAAAWRGISSDKAYDNTLRDCLTLRMQHQLCDWAYLQMLELVAKACVADENGATLLMAYLYQQSGYAMRLGIADGQLHMLFASRHQIYEKPYFLIGSERYYPLNCRSAKMQICAVGFPKEQPLSLLIPQEMLIAKDLSDWRMLTSERYPDLQVKVRTNKNAMKFYNDYPTSIIDNDHMTRWAMYANKPMETTVKEGLYPMLRERIKGYGQQEKVERLLNWVQTAFVYEYDDKVWGGDRAFFAEETLYYPYCDCEDRSILMSRLVRDLLGLKTILIYYPGHLAMAVGFTEDVKGDYIQLDGQRFVVCDPTYINAPVGCTMPGMDNQTAKVILLE